MVSKVFEGVPPPTCSMGLWLPKDREHIKQWIGSLIEEVEHKDSKTFALDPTIDSFKSLVSENSTLKKLSHDMFTQIPPAYRYDPVGKPQVRNFNFMLVLINRIIRKCPPWFNKTQPPTAMGMIGFPINAILDWPMGTDAGYCFFKLPEVNSALQAILNTWGSFLQSENSLETFTPWLSEDARKILAQKGNDGTTTYTFEQLYQCDPSKPHYGFKSWDDFFTRRFNEGIRPIEAQGEDAAILNACESAPLPLATDVKLQDQFWCKGQPYSLADMLDGDSRAEQFVGGTVYQAFLSATSYHCWHAPVAGRVAGIAIVPGTYYSENLNQGFANPGGPDPGAPNNSQPYISSVATRGIVFVEAKDPRIGLMAIVFIGMAEVSSCEFVVREGDSVAKGQVIGMFHFGGSTHCMVFRPETGLRQENFVKALPWGAGDPNNKVNGVLAILSKPV